MLAAIEMATLRPLVDASMARREGNLA